VIPFVLKHEQHLQAELHSIDVRIDAGSLLLVIEIICVSGELDRTGKLLDQAVQGRRKSESLALTADRNSHLFPFIYLLCRFSQTRGLGHQHG
jgi:hypothetical protein